jgi:hypothetical protein
MSSQILIPGIEFIGSKHGGLSWGWGKTSRHLRQLPSAPGVDRVLPVFVAPDDVLESILCRSYSDWVDWLKDGRIADGVSGFFHFLMHPKMHRIKCEVDRPTVGANDCEIGISLVLPFQERELIAALLAREEEACRLHLMALGFLPLLAVPRAGTHAAFGSRGSPRGSVHHSWGSINRAVAFNSRRPVEKVTACGIFNEAIVYDSPRAEPASRRIAITGPAVIFDCASAAAAFPSSTAHTL